MASVKRRLRVNKAGQCCSQMRQECVNSSEPDTILEMQEITECRLGRRRVREGEDGEECADRGGGDKAEGGGAEGGGEVTFFECKT